MFKSLEVWLCILHGHNRSNGEGYDTHLIFLCSSEPILMLDKNLWGHPEHSSFHPHVPTKRKKPQWTHQTEQSAHSRKRQHCLLLGFQAVPSQGLGERNCGWFQRIVCAHSSCQQVTLDRSAPCSWSQQGIPEASFPCPICCYNYIFWSHILPKLSPPGNTLQSHLLGL